jgi:uncharacterized protein YrzB (UPF0473 family)
MDLCIGEYYIILLVIHSLVINQKKRGSIMSEHNHDGSCDCGQDHEFEHDSITLSLDDGTELNCIVLEIFTVDDKEYIALQPEEGEEEDDNVFLYRYIQENDDEPQLLNIDDDDEFEAVADAFEELLDSEEYDEMFDDEEAEEEDE